MIIRIIMEKLLKILSYFFALVLLVMASLETTTALNLVKSSMKTNACP
jgi:hypothetical protein